MNPKKQIYKVPVTWTVDAEVEVKAWDQDDAIKQVEQMEGLPDNPCYVDGSFEILDAYPKEEQEQDINKETEKLVQDLLLDEDRLKAALDIFNIKR